MKHLPTDATLLAAPFGYGPLGKAMAVAHEFQGRGFTVKILGDKWAQKIATASGLTAGGYEYRRPLDFRELNTGVVLSFLDVSTPVNKSHIPLLLVDSLFWLRGRWERLPDPSYPADRILVQRFFVEAPEAAKRAVSDKLHVVDAILPASLVNLKPNDKGEHVLLYPGGMRSPYLGSVYQEKYLQWGLNVVVKAMDAAGIGHSDLVIITPPQMLSSATIDFARKLGSRIESSVDDVGSLIRDARCVVAAPGIGTMLEAHAMGKQPHFLPPFNGSHIAELTAYRQAGIGIELSKFADRFRDLEGDTDHLSGLSMKVAGRCLELLAQRQPQEEAAACLASSLAMGCTVENRYPLGKHGAAQVVDHALSVMRTNVA